MAYDAPTAVTPPKTKPSNNILDEVERLNARLSSTCANLNDLRDRVSGPRPPSSQGAESAETAFALGGFVGTVGQALERAQRMLTDINETINEITDVI